mgnify:CR=1 FL=1
MRSRLILCAVAGAALAACVGEAPAGRVRAMTIEIALAVPEEAGITASDPASPVYQPPGEVRLTFTNRGTAPLSFPGPAILQQVVREYSLRRGLRKQTFVRSEPPSDRAELVTLEPGEAWSWGFSFEYPDQLAGLVERSDPLTICAIWDKASLNRSIYPTGSYDWAESFRVCGETRLFRD